MTTLNRVFIKTDKSETIAASITAEQQQQTVKELTEHLLLKLNIGQPEKYELRLASSEALLPEASLVKELVKNDDILVLSECKSI